MVLLTIRRLLIVLWFVSQVNGNCNNVSDYNRCVPTDNHLCCDPDTCKPRPRFYYCDNCLEYKYCDGETPVCPYRTAEELDYCANRSSPSLKQTIFSLITLLYLCVMCMSPCLLLSQLGYIKSTDEMIIEEARKTEEKQKAREQRRAERLKFDRNQKRYGMNM